MSHPGRSSVFRTEDLTAALRRSIVDLCVAAHEEPGFEAMFTEFIPSGGRHFLVWRDDELVSHAVVTTRWLQPAGHALLRTAFVDAVSTRPEYQGMGYGTMVMRGLPRASPITRSRACRPTAPASTSGSAGNSGAVRSPAGRTRGWCRRPSSAASWCSTCPARQSSTSTHH
jgi:hypothetical protein